MARNTMKLLGLATVAVIAACADNGATGLRSSNSVASNGELPPAVVTLCKIGPAGSSATFSIATSGGGTLLLGSEVTLAATTLDNPEGCVEVWKSFEPQQDPDVVQTVTVTEVASPGTQLEKIVMISTLDGNNEFFPPVNSATMHVNYASGGIMFFKNTNTPNMGGDGCTPGYWKQKQHFDSYPAPYTPNTLFNSVFANAFGNKTFLQVMSTGGGGLIALGRHSVAAFLNASNSAVDYGLTPAQVVAIFNEAYATGDYERAKNELAGLNERGCPLN